jgi:hypothetical protein
VVSASLPSEQGPWFIAGYYGSCSGCGEDISPGDEIRADGHGRWEGRCCDDGARRVSLRAVDEAEDV